MAQSRYNAIDLAYYLIEECELDLSHLYAHSPTEEDELSEWFATPPEGKPANTIQAFIHFIALLDTEQVEYLDEEMRKIYRAQLRARR